MLGEGAVDVGLRLRQRPLQPSSFKTEYVDLETFGEHIHGDVVGDVPVTLTIGRAGHNHFTPSFAKMTQSAVVRVEEAVPVSVATPNKTNTR